ncbi:MAG: hypothetical protein V4560_14965 [Bacteroidota bacterium]
MDNLQLTPAQTFSLFDTNKPQRVNLCAMLVADIEDGLADPLKVQTHIKMLEDIINTLTNTDVSKNKNADIAKRYRSLVMDAAAKYGAKFELHNAAFSVSEVGVRYDFSMCGDPYLERIEKDKVRADAELKTRQELLKTVPVTGMEIIDTETGEAVTIYPPSKSGTTALKTTLK